MLSEQGTRDPGDTPQAYNVAPRATPRDDADECGADYTTGRRGLYGYQCIEASFALTE